MKAWLTGGFPDMGRDGKMRLGGIIVPEALFSAQHACNPLPIHSTHNYSVLFILQIPKNPIPLHFQSEGISFACLFQSWRQATEKHTSPDGGIGRRAGLKHQWSNPCRFDPGSGYPLNRKSLIFKDLRFFFWFLHHICTTKICRLPESRRVSSAFLSENCSRYPHFLGYQEQFRYVFAIGLLLLEKLRMSAKTYEFDYIRVFIEPDQQGIAFYVALHAVFIFA